MQSGQGTNALTLLREVTNGDLMLIIRVSAKTETGGHHQARLKGLPGTEKTKAFTLLKTADLIQTLDYL